MNLGDELRSTLNQEADMQVTAGPNVDRLIAGGRARRRRRNVQRAGGAALALALIGGGAYAVAQGGRSDAGPDRIANQESVTPEPSETSAVQTLPEDRGSSPVPSGTYRLMVGSDATGEPFEAEVTFEGAGWWGGNFPMLGDGDVHGGFGVYRPYALAAGDGCEGGPVDGDLPESRRALASRLTELPGSTLVDPVAPTELLGRDALHLRVRIPQTCNVEVYYRIAETARGGRGITYGYQPPPAVVDFWVIGVGGVPVVVDAWHDQGAPADLVRRIEQAVETITFVDGG